MVYTRTKHTKNERTYLYKAWQKHTHTKAICAPPRPSEVYPTLRFNVRLQTEGVTTLPYVRHGAQQLLLGVGSSQC